MANRWNCDDYIEIADDEYQDAKPSAALLAKSLEDYVQDDDAYYYDENTTMQLHEIEDEKEDIKKFKFNPEEEFSNCNGDADRIWWKDYFEQKLELEKEKLQKEHQRHKDNMNYQKMALIQDKLKIEAVNSLTSAIKEYTRLAEAKQENDD